MSSSESCGQSETARSPILEHSVGYLLKRAHMVVSRELHSIFGELGISAVQFSVLLLVRDYPGITQRELAAALLVERPRMVPVIDKLVDRDLAKRRVDDGDRRARQIHLTPAGMDLLVLAEERFAAYEARFTSELGGKSRDELVAALRTLLDLPAR